MESLITSSSDASSERYLINDDNNNLGNNKKKSRKPGLSFQTWSNLTLFAVSEVLGGVTYSLLSPFYTREAQKKGMTVSETGMVYSTAFIVTIIFAPIFGKYISRIGSKELFVGGTFIAGTTNILFGMLEWVMDRTQFFAFSLIIRAVTAAGEAAFFSSIYPLAAQEVDVSMRSTVLSVMETMFGIGLMFGPFVGGLLYEIGGFYLPFVISGSVLFLCTLFSAHFILIKSSSSFDGPNFSGESPVHRYGDSSFLKLLKIPSVSLSSLILCITSTGVSWYLPSLQPFLEKKFQLGTVGIGVMFMLDGATYAIFSPIWGYLLDHGLKPVYALAAGCCFIIIGYSLLGPLPFLTFIPSNVYIVGIGLFIHGCGTAANFITTLTFMMAKSVEFGAPDSEQTRSMITSLWFINECIGGYVGSTLGGVVYDSIGFEWGTLFIVTAMILTLVIFVPTIHFTDREPPRIEDEDRKFLLPQATSARIYSTAPCV